MKRIDLHIHTNISDGFLSPKEVIDEAYKNNVQIISIADHDNIDAYNKDLFLYAKSKNIRIIPAVEISTKNNKAGIHILGYNFDINNINFKEKLIKIRKARHDYLHEVAKKLSELGYFLNVKKLDEIESVTKAHIALDIVKNNKNKNKLIKEFGNIPRWEEFLETTMNENCPAYVKKRTLTPKEATRIIREANGKVVLAHPVSYIYEDNFTKEDILELIKDIEPDGIEANYLYVDRNQNLIDETRIWNEFAKKNNLFVTAGSDFHRKEGIRPEIGFINTNLVLDDNAIDEMVSNLIK